MGGVSDGGSCKRPWPSRCAAEEMAHTVGDLNIYSGLRGSHRAANKNFDISHLLIHIAPFTVLPFLSFILLFTSTLQDVDFRSSFACCNWH